MGGGWGDGYGEEIEERGDGEEDSVQSARSGRDGLEADSGRGVVMFSFTSGVVMGRGSQPTLRRWLRSKLPPSIQFRRDQCWAWLPALFHRHSDASCLPSSAC